MRGLTRLGLALVIVFLVCLLALAVELVYLLWYRRRSFRRVSSDQELAAATVAAGDSLQGNPTSKELLLYVLCWKNQSRIEPTAAPVAKPSPPPPPPQPAEEDVVDDELEKWRGMYASRVLFTISEGEKEGAESDGGSGRAAPPPGGGLTPFSTPCGSPPFFTPPPSPPRSSRNLLAGDEDEDEEDTRCGRGATTPAAAAAGGGGGGELHLESSGD
ncbi:unnamed protein product [Spirodela intermedia]|uniref:Uncharacterized protein n=1 Tax=Spirodela intermedia TaxID=51605 RepID=A0A7I8J0R7_SPIIN|nr:unnamed protein product [Spirodela intermedia]CAA6663737.1 unnamed protein product [Spirodela intermedia]